MTADGVPTPHREIFWKVGEQTAVRRGKWKLALNGQPVEWRARREARWEREWLPASTGGA